MFLGFPLFSYKLVMHLLYPAFQVFCSGLFKFADGNGAGIQQQVLLLSPFYLSDPAGAGYWACLPLG